MTNKEQIVIRRVGGLEDSGTSRLMFSLVIRRVGGLEVVFEPSVGHFGVIRRVGGLEVTVGTFLRLPLT